jgi:hypothetical protein
MHVRRESNPQPAVLETAALPIELLTYHLFALFAGGDTAAQLNTLLSCAIKLEYESEQKMSLGFFMRCSLLAPRAILLVLYPAGLLLLILCCRIIASLTICTL